jgi:anti-anti-sigma factor
VDNLKVVGGATISIAARNGETIIGLAGEIDMANANDVLTQVLAIADHNNAIVLDLGDLGYIDSAGVRMLFDISEALKRLGGRLVLAVGSDALVRRVLDVTKLDTLVAIERSLDAAIESARS